MYLIIIVLIIFDQLIKYIVVNNFTLGQSIKVINSFFSITYVANDGAAFGILSGNKIFFVALACIISIFLLIYSKKRPRIEKYTYALLISGIIGNLIDRVSRGYVIDYLDFNIFGYNFPVFNFADICITVSAIMLLIIEVLENGKNNCNN